MVVISFGFTDNVLLFFPQYNPPDYLPKVYEDLPVTPTHREAVINAFVYVHQTLHQANERLAKRGGRVMAITPRHYLDFINHYVSSIYCNCIVTHIGEGRGCGKRGLILLYKKSLVGFSLFDESKKTEEGEKRERKLSLLSPHPHPHPHPPKIPTEALAA